MSLKRIQRLLGASILFFGCIYILIATLDSSAGDMESEMKMRFTMNRLTNVEQELKFNWEEVNKVNEMIGRLLLETNQDPLNKRQQKEGRSHNFTRKKERMMSQRSIHDVVDSDVNMIDIYEKLKFGKVAGGVWKQGFTLETSDREWAEKKLRVFVLPHSHNDPGWLQTFENYFLHTSKFILNNVVKALSEDNKRRFIWAEISYLSLWWEIAGKEQKMEMRRLIDNGQLEIVTGGWVMNDEANTHYSAMIDQMIEGNEWVSRNLGVIPKNGWAIDPFGHSSTMAYILKKMKFESMLIQRIHYSVKKHLAQQKNLEFRWRQSWSHNTDTDIFCHMMPFSSYAISESCGPDRKVCCQFDFARMLSAFRACSWGLYQRPNPITNRNVKQKSLLLLDQYRKKAKLFRSNTLLVPHGDDFRYVLERETQLQFENLQKVFDYINSNPELNTEVRFGTLEEYFHAVKEDIGGEQNFPTLTGDFFTYADRDDDYWSGYYVTRPFYKMQERILESHLRGAEILFSLSFPSMKGSQNVEELYRLLVEGRRNLALFQHHDGITGTAREHVVEDYAAKMWKSISDMKKVQLKAAMKVIKLDLSKVSYEGKVLHGMELIEISPEQSANILLYNSLAYQRTGVISFLVSSPFVRVRSVSGRVLPCQVNHVWESETRFDGNRYEAQILATVPGLGLESFLIEYHMDNQITELSHTVFYNLPQSKRDFETTPFQISFSQNRNYILLENDRIEARFSSTDGFLQYVTDKAARWTEKVALSFVEYTTKSGGAYLFKPVGAATPYQKQNPIIRMTKGPLSSQIQVHLPHIIHNVVLYRGTEIQSMGIHLFNDIDIRKKFDNKEIAMRISSDLRSADRFYTDLNGFQTQQRTTYAKLPIQGNFYPMPSMAFIQDQRARISLFSAQPLGVASLTEGTLDVIMDRRLMQDDARGLGQGVKDNLPTTEKFVLLMEHWLENGDKFVKSALSYPSFAAHRVTWELLHPIRIISNNLKLPVRFSPLSNSEWPCDVHLVNLRSIQDRSSVGATDQSALLLHRVAVENKLSSNRLFNSNCSHKLNYNVDVTSLLPISDVISTSLSLQKDDASCNCSSFRISPMEIEAFKVKMKKIDLTLE